MKTYTTHIFIPKDFKDISKVYKYPDIKSLLQACKKHGSPDFIVLSAATSNLSEEQANIIENLSRSPNVYIIN